MEKCYVITKQLREKFRKKKDYYNRSNIEHIYIPIIILAHYFWSNYDKFPMLLLEKSDVRRKKIRG